MNLANCILWGNNVRSGHVIYLFYLPRGSTACTISHTNIHEGVASVYVNPGAVLNWNNGNVDVDPVFAIPGHWDPNGTPEDANNDFWVGDDYHLRPDSPCINAGDPNFVAEPNSVDIDGEKRVMLGRVDMGADEFNPFLAEFVVVRRERVDRTVFEYECQVVLENISRFEISNVSLEMAEWSKNITITDPNVTVNLADFAKFADQWIKK